MLGKRPENYTLFDVGNVWDLELSPKSFYYQLAVAARKGLFKDEHFAEMYVSPNGRPSVPPSLMALLVILQTRDGVSDEQAIEHSAYDARWAAVLGRPIGKPLCVKSTLQLFRAHLLIHGKSNDILKTSIDEAKAHGLIDGKALTVALDTKPMLGRGAVQDTYNLLAQAMRQLSRALARDAGTSIRQFLDSHELEALAEPSIKGSAVVDWNDEEARNAFLSTLVAQARKLLELAKEGSGHARENAELLSQILLQDIEEATTSEGGDETSAGCSSPTGDTAKIRQETVTDRMPSATDPEQRHGRKSASKRFNGHKSSIVADTKSGIILSCDVLAGNAGDATGALEQVREAERNAGFPIAQTLGDCAYGGAETRAAFADAKRSLIAKVPAPPGGPFGKSAFHIDLDQDTVTCPAGHTSNDYDTDPHGRKTFYFDAFCSGCPLRDQCTKSKFGRTVSVHPNERELQQARSFQNTPEGRSKLKRRLTVENALARLSRYGISQARYFGRTKSKFQLTMACAVANFRKTWSVLQNEGDDGNSKNRPDTAILGLFVFVCRVFRRNTPENRPFNRQSYILSAVPLPYTDKIRGYRLAF
jgi:hypothetical protein